MDVVMQQPNSSRNSEQEDESLSTVNDVLQNLITNVDDRLRSEEDMASLNGELPNININEGRMNNSKPEENINSSECNLIPSQPGLTIKDQTYYNKNFQDWIKNSECKSGSNSIGFGKQEQLSYENEEEDLMGSTKYVTGPSYKQPILNVEEEETVHENNEDLEPLDEYYDDALENNEYIDVVGIDTVVDPSPENEHLPDDDFQMDIDNFTVDVISDAEEMDSIDDDEIPIPEIVPREEIGDRNGIEVFDINGILFVVMLGNEEINVENTQGSGDTSVIDSDDESD